MTQFGFALRQIRSDYWLELVAVLALIGALAWLGYRTRSARRAALWAAATVLALRVVLLGNPIAWQVYERLLDGYKVGWRQYDLIRIQRQSYFVPTAPLRYLAVGSSQTGAIYGQYADQHDDFDTYVVAAMMPMDFVLHADEIARRKPETVLLYLSDFDIAKKPTPEALVVAPLQGFGLAAILWRLHQLTDRPDLNGTAVELVAGELFVEFRFRFVFRGLVDAFFARIARRVALPEAPRGPRPVVNPELVEWLRDSLGDDHIAFNLGWLDGFLGEMRREGIEVVIVEGDYHPSVTNAETARLNAKVNESLERLAAEVEGVRFVSREALEQFAAEDYRDLTHVTPDAAERFARRLRPALEKPADARRNN